MFKMIEPQPALATNTDLAPSQEQSRPAIRKRQPRKQPTQIRHPRTRANRLSKGLKLQKMSKTHRSLILRTIRSPLLQTLF